jgi:hypothetical protein
MYLYGVSSFGAPFLRLIPILNQGAIFVGSSSAPQYTVVCLCRLNPRRLDITPDLELE